MCMCACVCVCVCVCMCVYVCVCRVDGEESDSARITALSDTEVEVSDRRSSSYWDHKKVSRRTEHDTKVSMSPEPCH